jgi:hypothetical protein
MQSIRRSPTLALGAVVVLTATFMGTASPQARPSSSAGPMTLAATSTTAAATMPVQGPLIFGTSAPDKANLVAQEAVAGRELVAVREYRLWDSPLFGPDELWMRDTYHTLFLSIKAVRMDGSIVPWADIAAATPGTQLYSDMQGIATQLKAFGARVFLTFNHEPETSTANGTGADFAAAFRNFITVMRAEQVDNIVPTAIFTGFGFTRTDAQNVDNYYPGDSYVSVVGVDVYNWGDCHGGGWRPLAQSIEGARVWGLAHPSIPMVLTEWGSVEDPAVPGAKAAWIADAGNLFLQPAYSQFAGLIAWGGLNPNTACPFDYNTSPSAAAAWAGVGQNPAYSAWQ